MPLNYTDTTAMGIEPGRKLQSANGGRLIVLELVWLKAEGKNAPKVGGVKVWETGANEREHLLNIDTVKSWMDSGKMMAGWSAEWIPNENKNLSDEENND